MANDFSGDGACKALWKFDNGALTTDSIGGNTLTDNNTVGTDTSNYQEGDASADFTATNSEYLSITNADLDAGFPLKSGDSTKIITVCLWVYPTYANDDRGFWGLFDYGNNKRTLQLAQSDTGNGRLIVHHGHNAGASAESVECGSDFTASRWFHFCYRYQDSGHGSGDKYYKIDVWDDTAGAYYWQTSGNHTNAINIEDSPLVLGSLNGGVWFFNGDIDECVVFNDFKSDDDIEAIRAGTYGAAAGVAPTAAFYGPLVGPLGGPI